MTRNKASRPYWKTVGQAFQTTFGNWTPFLWFLFAAAALIGSDLPIMLRLKEPFPGFSNSLAVISDITTVVYMSVLTRSSQNLPREAWTRMAAIAAVILVRQVLFWTPVPLDSSEGAVMGLGRSLVSLSVLLWLVGFEFDPRPRQTARILRAIGRNLHWFLLVLLGTGALIVGPSMLLIQIKPTPFGALAFNAEVITPLIRTGSMIFFWAILIRALSPRMKYFDHATPDFQRLSDRLDEELAALNGELRNFYNTYNKLEGIHDVVLAYQEDTVVGCGALKPFEEGTYELKRMYVVPEYRRRGIAEAVVRYLETVARSKGARRIVLETGASFEAPVALYRGLGYQVIENYGQYRGVAASVCMAKEL